MEATGSTSALVEFAVDAFATGVADDVAEHASLLLYDTLVCMIAGGVTESSRIARSVLVASGGAPAATLVPDGQRTSVGAAAFVNAVAANALDMDENLLYSTHIGPTVLAAALATGEAEDASLGDVAAASVIGYEVAARLALAMPGATVVAEDDGNRAVQWPSPNTLSYNTVGAVIACGLLRDLDRTQLEGAVGMATLCAPLASAGRSARATEWPLSKFGALGFQAWAACHAAASARRGMDSERAVLDPPEDFWSMSGMSGHDRDVLREGLGERWWALQNSFRLESAMTWTRSAVRAARLARGNVPCASEDIDEVEIRTRTLGGQVFLNREPETYIAAHVSYPYVVACAASGTPVGTWFEGAAFHDPELRRLTRTAIILPWAEADDALVRDLQTAPYRATGIPARVTLRLRDGRELVGESRFGDGDPSSDETRVSRAKLDRKFADFAAPRLPASSAAALQELLVDTDAPIRRVMGVFTDITQPPPE